MNFMITWFFDKLGYMPKIDMQIGKVVTPFPVESVKKKPALKKATTRKTTKKVK
jgi:hypothetical protein